MESKNLDNKDLETNYPSWIVPDIHNFPVRIVSIAEVFRHFDTVEEAHKAVKLVNEPCLISVENYRYTEKHSKDIKCLHSRSINAEMRIETRRDP